MDYSTDSNVIIGSKLALAMSMAIKNPVRLTASRVSDKTRVEFAKLDRRCESLKNRSLKLMDGTKAEHDRIAIDAARMRNPTNREASKRLGKMIGKMMDQQISLHSKMEKLLDAMMLQIRIGKESNS